ncbi:MAG: hypothetical protein LZF61_10195 [Nitrosomonas sp.]|nr:MAG: hypothetical protein LZF61_10195 [Nitrosomonas sp.]
MIPSIIKGMVLVFGFIGAGFWSFPAFAECSGCLCPGDPCKLCPLPAQIGDPPKTDEHELCARIRAKVPPIDAQPGTNEYFPSLDKSVMICISEGGDVIRNRQKLAEFPSRVYCKPPKQPKIQN